MCFQNSKYFDVGIPPAAVQNLKSQGLISGFEFAYENTIKACSDAESELRRLKKENDNDIKTFSARFRNLINKLKTR